MISYINGELTFLTPTLAIVEAAGVGYEIHISLHAYSALNGQKKVKLITYHHIREDAQLLYGFANEQEKQLFLLLLSVNGIGPNTARTILSSSSVEELLHAISGAQLQFIQKIKGIGVKTAQRIVIELREKATAALGTDPQLFSANSNNNLKEEALLALIALGFSKQQMEKIISQILRENQETPTVEYLIKQALKLV